MLQFLQAVVPHMLSAAGSGTTTSLEVGNGFDIDQISKLKDACGVRNAKQIPPIWAVIQKSKGKTFDPYQAHLTEVMDSRCRMKHIRKDRSIFLGAKFFDNLVALRFNPGGAVAQYLSISRGILMLACRSLNAVEAEYQSDYKELASHTSNTRSLKELLKGNQGKVVLPAPDYMQLKLNIRTYCALLWALFGDHCNYYKELYKIHRILDREECFMIQSAYTPEICMRITWAIECSFFGRNPISTNFAPGKHYKFSVSCLESITGAVWNALSIMWATFPKEWMSTVPPAPHPTPQNWANPIPTGPPPAQWPAPAPAPAPAPGGPVKEPTPPREDIRHPKIKALMDPYLRKYNNQINLIGILNVSGKCMTDLPTLDKYCTPTGMSYICWNSVLGKCYCNKQCTYPRGHIVKGDMTDGLQMP